MSYCKNCGQQVTEGTGVCPVCGCPAGMGINYCGQCGEKLVPGSSFCVHCGAPAATPVTQPATKTKKARSRWAAAAYGIVMGAFGVHNFYLGHAGKGIAQIAITIGVYSVVLGGGIPGFAGLLLSGLWGFIEGVQIAVGDIKTDAEGKALRQWGEE